MAGARGSWRRANPPAAHRTLTGCTSASPGPTPRGAPPPPTRAARSRVRLRVRRGGGGGAAHLTRAVCLAGATEALDSTSSDKGSSTGSHGGRPCTAPTHRRTPHPPPLLPASHPTFALSPPHLRPLPPTPTPPPPAHPYPPAHPPTQTAQTENAPSGPATAARRAETTGVISSRQATAIAAAAAAAPAARARIRNTRHDQRQSGPCTAKPPYS